MQTRTHKCTQPQTVAHPPHEQPVCFSSDVSTPVTGSLSTTVPEPELLLLLPSWMDSGHAEWTDFSNHPSATNFPPDRSLHLHSEKASPVDRMTVADSRDAHGGSHRYSWHTHTNVATCTLPTPPVILLVRQSLCVVAPQRRRGRRRRGRRKVYIWGGTLKRRALTDWAVHHWVSPLFHIKAGKVHVFQTLARCSNNWKHRLPKLYFPCSLWGAETEFSIQHLWLIQLSHTQLSQL